MHISDRRTDVQRSRINGVSPKRRLVSCCYLSRSAMVFRLASIIHWMDAQEQGLFVLVLFVALVLFSRTKRNVLLYLQSFGHSFLPYCTVESGRYTTRQTDGQDARQRMIEIARLCNRFVSLKIVDLNLYSGFS